jgi:hypothetical protein
MFGARSGDFEDYQEFPGLFIIDFLTDSFIN